jgi:hypothetical protein
MGTTPCYGAFASGGVLVPRVIDYAENFRIDGSAPQ